MAVIRHNGQPFLARTDRRDDPRDPVLAAYRVAGPVLKWRKLIKSQAPSYVAVGNLVENVGTNPMAFWFNGEWFDNVDGNKPAKYVAKEIGEMRNTYDFWIRTHKVMRRF